jgi:hypothetical protein|tara:strand:+ start:5610 stop:6527 length:918 start_codon:yes stop_codon:yes gene_type:complete
MRIAVFGDSKASEEQWDLTLKYNPSYTEQDKQNTWINLLRQDGHTVDVYSRMSCDNSWINSEWQDIYRSNHSHDGVSTPWTSNKAKVHYDRFIIRPAPVGAVPYNVDDDKWKDWHKGIFNDLGPSFSNKEETPHPAIVFNELYQQYVTKEFACDIWKTYMFNWTYDKHSVLVIPSEQDRLLLRNNYLFLESHWQTETLKPKMHMIEWRLKTGSMGNERQKYLTGFRERNPGVEWKPTKEHYAKLFHKHFNHNTPQAHAAIHKYIDHWLHYYEQSGVIECDSFGQYEWPCPILEQIEEEMCNSAKQ